MEEWRNRGEVWGCGEEGRSRGWSEEEGRSGGGSEEEGRRGGAKLRPTVWGWQRGKALGLVVDRALQKSVLTQ